MIKGSRWRDWKVWRKAGAELLIQRNIIPLVAVMVTQWTLTVEAMGEDRQRSRSDFRRRKSGIL
jgi:hypothetical protein